MNTLNENTTKSNRIEWLKIAQQKLSDLKKSSTATAEEINNAEYSVALKLGILHDMDGMSN
jgi:hypothetical protein